MFPIGVPWIFSFTMFFGTRKNAVDWIHVQIRKNYGMQRRSMSISLVVYCSQCVVWHVATKAIWNCAKTARFKEPSMEWSKKALKPVRIIGCLSGCFLDLDLQHLITETGGFCYWSDIFVRKTSERNEPTHLDVFSMIYLIFDFIFRLHDGGHHRPPPEYSEE